MNHSTIFQLFDKAMHILWGNGVKHNDVLLFVSDAAPYMKEAGDCIKALYPKLIHMTFLAHTLHNACEEVHAHCTLPIFRSVDWRNEKTDNRVSFTSENLAKYMVVNSFLIF